ncbi:hypothetical protein DL98DRAFT_543107 [Cadophora sp. DSE1049]|nr:hypothetical protein DL98DRAFT_543107 [Cadophora sp. DSE1049]
MSLDGRVRKNRGRSSSKPQFTKGTTQERVLNPERRSKLLLSKSNYQLLMEGESSQVGISFPPNTMESLSAKRSVATIAERGRRNDLKRVLEELGALLSQDCCDEASRNAYAVRHAGKLAKAQARTKVRTLELAIEYIKCLQNEVAGVKSSLKEISSNSSSGNSEAVTKVQLSI